MTNVSTTDYEFAHGKKPRGYGSWAFFFDFKRDVQDAKFFTGTYADTKRMAVNYAKANRHHTVSVGS